MKHAFRMAAVAVTALLSIGLTAAAGHAQDDDQAPRVGLLNLNNQDLIHNVSACLSLNSMPTVLGVDLSSFGITTGSCDE